MLALKTLLLQEAWLEGLICISLHAGLGSAEPGTLVAHPLRGPTSRLVARA